MLLNRLETKARRAARQMGSNITRYGAIRPALPPLPSDHVMQLASATDAMAEPRRVGGSRGLMHLTSLIGDTCMRKHVLGERYRLQTAERVTGAHKVMWKIGRAVEHHVRSSVIHSRGGIGVFGVWKCTCGAIEHMGTKPDERTCSRCGTPVNVYHEPQLANADIMLSGSPDLTLVERNYFVVIEIKSMNRKQFDALKRPLADHAIQALGYRRLYEELGYLVHDHVRVVYVCKDFQWSNHKGDKLYKEFVVEPAQFDSELDLVWERAETFTQSVRNDTLPPRICDEPNHARARSCPACATCFQMEE